MKNLELKLVPQKPGVYLWKDKNQNIIYVGKAKNLKNRMKQYFKGMLNSYKTAKMVEMIADFEYIITNSNKEALILERNLIEKYHPEFNIKLTDDKRYPYIRLKLGKALEISLVYRYRKSQNKTTFFGPYPTGHGAMQIVKLIARMTKYKNGILHKNNDEEYWKKQYKFAKSLLSSKQNKFINQLKKQMTEAAEKMQFEIANDIKETIKAISFNQDQQAVEFATNEDVDVIAFHEKNGFLSIAMLFYRKGALLSKKEHIVEIITAKSQTINEFINQYYWNNIKPEYIISNQKIDTDIKVLIPQKGQKKKVLKVALENAKDNIDIKLSQFIRSEELTIGAIKKLEKILKIKSAAHILMIDNSNTNNTNPVSGIVSYRNGIKQKHEYRKFNLKTGSRLSDVDYMRQGIQRYFKDKEKKLPDLFIVDGGVAQVNEAKKVAPKELKIIGLVKNEKHTTEAIINLSGQRIKIQDQMLLNFLRKIQEEVDRFARAQHQKRRKTTLEGILMTVEGIGQKTEKKLIDYFKSYSAIYNATIEDLEKVVSSKIAKNIIKALGRK